MALTYCFESHLIPSVLARCKKNDLAVIDTEGHEKAIREAVSRGVYVYGYRNVGALEKERPYYEKLEHLRLAKYEGWDGEYWIDPTAEEWKEHIVALAKTIKATGAIGVYLDNTDIYYMCGHGFGGNAMRKAPSKDAVYKALENDIMSFPDLITNGFDKGIRLAEIANIAQIKTTVRKYADSLIGD